MNRWVLAVSFLTIVTLQAGYTFFTPDGSFTIEISLENSSYPRLPIYRNAITSLEVAGDSIVGGTSAKEGLSPFVFTASLSRRELTEKVDLETMVADQRALQSGFARIGGDLLYAGTMPDKERGSGHLLRIDLTGDRIKITDLGAPLPNEGIFALTGDSGQKLYGISHPSGIFFSFDLASQTASVFRETVPSAEELSLLAPYSLTPSDYLSRRLVTDRNGRIYGSSPVNRIFRFHPDSETFQFLEQQLPEVWGRRTLGRVDSWAISEEGILYGGNAGDGQLFRLDPQSNRLANLGKPIMMPRLKALAFAGNGKLYGVAGGMPGYAHLFYYDPAGPGFVDLGNPRFPMQASGLGQAIAWRGFQIATMATSEDGKFIVMGEEEALSQIMVFPTTVH